MNFNTVNQRIMAIQQN